VVRFRAPRGAGRVVRFVDEVYGDQARDGDEIEDFALLRSTGMPTYHMASCADDADLRISHVVRGQDHLSNTFKHVLLFEAMGVEAPRFAHLPLLLAPDGSKLSKRKHGPAVSVTTYRDAGFLPQAYVNFLCLLGWSPKDNREQMTRGEIVEAFTLEGVKRSNAVVNFTEEDPVDPKALWLNGHHLREMPVGELLPYVRRELAGAGLAAPEEEERFAEVVEVIRTRYGTLRDFVTRGRAYFVEDFTVDPELLAPGTRELLRELGERLEAEGEFSEAAIEKELRGLAAERGVGAGVLLRGARAVLTGQSVGPGAFAVFTILGRKRAIARLRAA
jgi:glutamyl-tRNA synthetase